MSSSIISPFPFFTDTTGAPLESGYIYIGQSNLNPETSPVNVFWDAALTIPAAQPVRTVGGYPSRAGTPSRFYSATDTYSITVRNKNHVLVFSAFDQTDSPSSVFDISTQLITATAGQTTFTLTTFNYLPGTDTLQVYRNGLRLNLNLDYLETNSSTVTLTAPAALGDQFLFQGGAVVTGNQVPGSQVSFLQAGTGAVTRNMQDKVRESVSVKDFGAIGDGTTDDTAAIQAAVNSVSSNGGQVIFPSGSYKTTSEILIPSSNVSLIGDSELSTKIIRIGSGNTIRFYSASGLNSVGVSRISFIGQDVGITSGNHLVFKNCYKITVQNVNVNNGFSGFEFESSNNIRVHTVNMNFTNALSSSARHGMHFVTQNADVFVSFVNIWMGYIVTTPSLAITCNGDYGFHVEACDGLWISDTHVACSKQANFGFGNSLGWLIANIFISNTMSDHCDLDGVRLSGTSIIYSFHYSSGKVSSIGLGLANGNGIAILSPCLDVLFSCTVDGFNGNGIYIANPQADAIVLSDFYITNNNADYPGAPDGDGILIESCSNLTICNGVIDGSLKQNFGIRATGAGAVNWLAISNVIVSRNNTAGLKINYGGASVQRVTITGCDFRNNTTPYAFDGTPSLLSVENSLGISPIIKNFTWTPGAISAGGTTFTSVNIPGVTANDFVEIGFGSTRTGVTITAYVDYADTVFVLIYNGQAAPVTLGATTFKIKVEKYFGNT